MSEADKEGAVIGVLRSDMGFFGERPQQLRAFADALIANDPGYDRRGAFNFKEVKTRFEEQLQFLLDSQYGKVTPNEELAQRQYFCSALVVACYLAVGIIGDTAQLAYQAEAFSPADLHKDPTFGWFLGYITANRSDIPSDDPLLADHHLARRSRKALVAKRPVRLLVVDVVLESIRGLRWDVRVQLWTPRA